MITSIPLMNERVKICHKRSYVFVNILRNNEQMAIRIKFSETLCEYYINR